ncbi:MAG: DNRLRE domain-containing protein [Planctomycetes bacterium]|nr:DNRLRE domain-containing protein [Planctomycetota bacterium]
MSQHAIAGALLGWAVLAAPAPASHTVTVEAGRDNTLFSTDDGSASNGAGPNVFSGRTGAGGTRQRALLWFDVSGAVPAGATIVGAELTLTVIQGGGAPAQEHTLHRVLADWGEGTSIGAGGNGAPSTPDDATWLHTFFPGQFWSSPGGDFDDAASTAQTLGSTPGPVTWGPAATMTADVQFWLDTPASNHGWVLIGNEDVLNSARKLASREFDTPGSRPMLTIDYELPPPCPADLNGNGHVDFHDLITLIGAWGPCEGCPEDLSGNGRVGIMDLIILILAWGPCED